MVWIRRTTASALRFASMPLLFAGGILFVVAFVIDEDLPRKSPELKSL